MEEITRAASGCSRGFGFLVFDSSSLEQHSRRWMDGYIQPSGIWYGLDAFPSGSEQGWGGQIPTNTDYCGLGNTPGDAGGFCV